MYSNLLYALGGEWTEIARYVEEALFCTVCLHNIVTNTLAIQNVFIPVFDCLEEFRPELLFGFL